MSFRAKWDERLSEKEAKKVIKNASILGYSDNEKDCYWACYQLNDKYYIGLNGESDVWEVEKSDIDEYNIIPVNIV